jgi:hypothetical protein
MALLTINGVAGGATSNTSGTGGAGSSPAITAGAGGAGTAGNGSGGAGGSITLTPGLGGAKTGSGTVGANGAVNIQAAGVFSDNLTNTITTAVSSSPLLVFGGEYQASGTPTYAVDTWSIQDVVGSGTNGTSTLTFVHSGSSGASIVSVPQLADSGVTGFGYFNAASAATAATAAQLGTLANLTADDIVYSGGVSSALAGAAINGFVFASTSGAPVAGTATNLGTLLNLTSNCMVKSGGTSSAAACSSATDNGTDITTTEPILAGNSATMAANGTVTSSSFVTFTTTTLVMPQIPASTVRRGSCDLIWETSATADTPTFALTTSATSTGFWILGSQYSSSTSAVVNFLPIAVVTSATDTAVTAAQTAANANTFYHTHVDFVLSTNANPQTITVKGKINGGTLTIQAGSGCTWAP